MFALAIGHDRRDQHQTSSLGEREHMVNHLADGLRFERNVVIGTTRRAGTRVQEAEIVVDLRDGADR